MSNRPTIPIKSAEEIARGGLADAPFFRWPEPSTVFAERQMRLTQLSNGHPMGEYLTLMADLARLQQQLLDEAPAITIPTTLDGADAAAPPLAAVTLPRASWWRDALRHIADAMSASTQEATRSVLMSLRHESDDELERRADDLLGERLGTRDLAAAPFVAAALEVCWTHALTAWRATVEDEGALRATAAADLSRCPACGSRPTTSITRSVGTSGGHRYLHCSLCNGEWHRPRATCTCCGLTEGVSYQSLDAITNADTDADAERAARAPIQAETCDRCNHYLKILHTDRDAMLEAGADDLASITLDLLVLESGRIRHGRNLKLLYADEPASADEVANA